MASSTGTHPAVTRGTSTFRNFDMNAGSSTEP